MTLLCRTPGRKGVREGILEPAGLRKSSAALLTVVLLAGGGCTFVNYPTGTDSGLVCHNGKTIRVSQKAIEAHIQHGDTMGPCGD